MDYGRELAATVLQRSPNTDFAARACNFGTNDIQLIIARIIQGLLRAQALDPVATVRWPLPGATLPADCAPDRLAGRRSRSRRGS